METKKPPVIFIVGPTGTGKTQLSIEVALSLKRSGCEAEIVNSDAFQVYKQFDIGTAKPTHEERMGVTHHLIDICEPTHNFRVAKFVSCAIATLNELHSRDVVPIVVGGTPLYTQSLLWTSTAETEESDTEYIREFDDMDADSAYALLSTIDPERAYQLHPNDHRRIIRSLVVFRKTGKKHSEMIKEAQLESVNTGLRHNSCILWVHCERGELNDRLDRRADKMIQNGLLREVKLMDSLTHTQHKMGILECIENKIAIRGVTQSIAYKEFIPVIPYLTSHGEIHDSVPKDLLCTCITKLKIHSHRFAKRQTRWIKMKFIKRQPHLPIFKFDTTSVSGYDDEWRLKVLNPAVAVTTAFCKQQPLSAFDTYRPSEAFDGCDEQSDDSDNQMSLKAVLRKDTIGAIRRTCDKCGIQLYSDSEWHAHLRSKQHKYKKCT